MMAFVVGVRWATARQGRRSRSYAGIRARPRTPHRAAQRGPTAQASSWSELSNSEVEVVAVEECEAGRAEDAGEDPKANHDLRLRPRLHLEMVVDRRHEKHTPPEVLEREHLDDHGDRRDQV